MKIKLVELSGIISAVTALRKPFKKEIRTKIPHESKRFYPFGCVLSDEDLELMSKLVKAGDEHAKCLRGITVALDVTAPRYFWHEHDTYNVGVSCLSSESTMHTIMTDKLSSKLFTAGTDKSVIDRFIVLAEATRELNLPKADLITAIKSILPEGYLQTETIQYNYQSLRRIYKQRKTHNLQEWKDFCKFIETLPYAKELIICGID